jgi:hypothetical protein
MDESKKDINRQYYLHRLKPQVLQIKNHIFEHTWWASDGKCMTNDRKMAMKFVAPIILKNVFIKIKKRNGDKKSRLTLTVFDENTMDTIKGVAYPADVIPGEKKAAIAKYIFYKSIPIGSVFTVRITQFKKDEVADYWLCLSGEGWGK